MATFVGYSTIGRYKNFTVTDFDLIKLDILNAFNIRQGELPGRPEVGSNIWAFLFESQTNDTIEGITNEISRVVAQDPRVTVQSIDVFPKNNGILVQIALVYIPGTDAERLTLFFDQTQQTAALV